MFDMQIDITMMGNYKRVTIMGNYKLILQEANQFNLWKYNDNILQFPVCSLTHTRIPVCLCRLM